MARMGMDIELVESYARRLEGQAVNEVAAVMSGMAGTVQELMQAWHGSDANLFDQEWAQHAQSLALLHTALGDLANTIAAAVREQRAASSN
jgi:uncharacterized protein YukE